VPSKPVAPKDGLFFISKNMENRYSHSHFSVIEQVGLKSAILFGVLDNLKNAPGTHKNKDGFFHVHGSRLAREVNAASKPALKKLIANLEASNLIDVAMIGNARHFRVIQKPPGKFLKIDWMIASGAGPATAAIVALIQEEGGFLRYSTQKIADKLNLGSYNTAAAAIKKAKKQKLICTEGSGLELHWLFEDQLKAFNTSERLMISYYEKQHGESLNGWSKSVSNAPKKEENATSEDSSEQRFFVKKKDKNHASENEKPFQYSTTEATPQWYNIESSNGRFLANTPIASEHLPEHSRSALRVELNGSPAAGLETSNGTCKNQSYTSKPKPPEAKPPRFRNAPPNTEEAQAFVMKLLQQAQRQP